MQQHELDALFDQQAAGYDARWVRMAPIRDSLLFLIDTVFATLPEAGGFAPPLRFHQAGMIHG